MKKVEVKTTKAEKRVLIAKDVLMRVKKGQYCATKGVYVIKDQIVDKFTPSGTQVQPLIKKAKVCEVCAEGALFLSCVAKYNKCDVLGFLTKPRPEIYNRFFSTSQMKEVEAAFEGWYEEGAGTFAESIYELSEEKRLVAILKNIIKNKGTFKP